MPDKETILRRGDAAIGGALILVFLLASFMADLYGVSAVMDNAISTWNQWLIAGGCVLVKACGLIKVRQAWREGFWPSAAAMGLLTVMAVVVSITNEMTYYNTNFSGKSARLEGEVSTSVDTAKEKKEIEARLEQNASVRPVGTIDGEIAAALAHHVKGDRKERTLGQMTKNCTETRSAAYDQCEKVLALRAELANAIEITPKMEKDTARLAVIRASKAWVTTVGEVSPGAGFWVRAYNRAIDWRGLGKEHYITNQDGQDALVVVLMLVLQSLNLLLPFAWFYKKADVKKAIAGLADRVSTPVVERISNDNVRLAEAKKPPVKRVEAASKSLVVPAPFPVEAIDPTDIKAFSDRYCVYGDGHTVRDSDVYACYLGAIGDGTPLTSKAFRLQLSALPAALRVRQFRDDHALISFSGMKLTPAGQKLLGNTIPLIEAVDAVGDRYADAA